MTTKLLPTGYVISKVLQRVTNQTGYCFEMINCCFYDFAIFNLRHKEVVSFDEVERLWEENAAPNLHVYLYDAA
ncbi:hypothetical protein [Colwellia sp. 12G3]|uniref:hypothetical protein n=1 Tax=Colwellia sp. 12G3 TaxID=2058299 RepID=UPI000C342C5D|nr:hypothetical protein [Colwellia sp. 12G3]PKI12769.1 hypothetical protein CXF71_18720 [Colwellia sp. 12G3]